MSGRLLANQLHSKNFHPNRRGHEVPKKLGALDAYSFH